MARFSAFFSWAAATANATAFLLSLRVIDLEIGVNLLFVAAYVE
jgi:hypothetical protein